MLIVLNEGCGLFQVVTLEMLFKHVKKLGYDRYAIFANDNTFHLDRTDPCVPVVLSNVSDSNALRRVCVKNLLHEIFALD